ncbi:MAG: hypothetical protein WDO15_25785 [Bacteroidota bacterium]
MKNAYSFALLLAMIISLNAFAQTEKVDTVTISKIKKEGFDHSKVMEIVSNLTDIHGPRLTTLQVTRPLPTTQRQPSNRGVSLT